MGNVHAAWFAAHLVCLSREDWHFRMVSRTGTATASFCASSASICEKQVFITSTISILPQSKLPVQARATRTHHRDVTNIQGPLVKQRSRQDGIAPAQCVLPCALTWPDGTSRLGRSALLLVCVCMYRSMLLDGPRRCYDRCTHSGDTHIYNKQNSTPPKSWEESQSRETGTVRMGPAAGDKGSGRECASQVIEVRRWIVAPRSALDQPMAVPGCHASEGKGGCKLPF